MYLISFAAVFFAAMRNYKCQEKLNGFSWLVVGYLVYEYAVCFAGGFFELVKVPYDLYTIAILNTAAAAFLLYKQHKSGKTQSYRWHLYDGAVLVVLLAAAIAAGYLRFGAIDIIYATSDPGVHLRMAMDSVNDKSVVAPDNGMYVGQFTNAIWIELMEPRWQGASVYIPFILKDVFNLFLSAAMFFTAVRGMLTTPFMKTAGVVVTLLYMMGYPLNNMVFGFVYLGIAVTSLLFLIFVAQQMNADRLAPRAGLSLLSLGAYTVGLGYTFFAPAVFIAIFLYLLLWMKKRELLFSGHFFSKHFFTINLYVFLIPTLMTLWFTLIWPRMAGGNEFPAAHKMNVEGYIFRNLWLDFFVFLPFALYAAWKCLREKRHSMGALLFGCFTVFQIGSFVLMVNEVVSTYYYFKLNFVQWALILFLTVVAISYLQQQKAFVAAIGCCYIGACVLTLSGLDYELNQKNVLFNPFPEGHALMEIYCENQLMYDWNADQQIAPGLQQVCDEVYRNYNSGDALTPYIGTWLENYWYEALSNERHRTNYAFKVGTEKIVREFLNGDYGDYIVVEKGSEEYAAAAEMLDGLSRVYENEFAFIAQRPGV